MSPGAGLRPSPPPLLRTQPPLPPRVGHPGGLCDGCSTFRKPSRCAGGRRLDKVKEEATAAGGRRGTFVQTPATRAPAPPLAVTPNEETKNPGRCRGFSFGTARAPYFFFGMYRSVIVPS